MIDTALQEIRYWVSRPGNLKMDLCAEAKLHPNTLRGCEADSWNPTANTIRRLLAGIETLETKQRA